MSTILKVALDPLTLRLLAEVDAYWRAHSLAPTSIESPLPHMVRKAIRLYLEESRKLPELGKRMEEVERAERGGVSSSAEQTHRVLALARPRGRPRKEPAKDGRGRL